MRTTVGTIGIVTSLVAIAAYFLNRHKLRHAARRLNVYMNISHIIGPGSDTIFAAFSPIAESIACYPDGTLRVHEPNTIEGASACVFFSGKYIYFSLAMLFLGVGVAQEWYFVISTMGNLKKWDTFSQKERTREKVYVITTAVLSGILTALPLARSKVRGTPERGSCLVESSDLIYVVTTTSVVFVFIMIIYLCQGLPKLCRLYEGMRVFPRRTESFLRRNSAVSSDGNDARRRSGSMTLSNLKSLMKLLSLYIMSSFLCIFSVAVVFIYVFAKEEEIKADIERHILCKTSSCTPEKCPPLPKLNPALLLLPELYNSVTAVILCIWAFNWRTYWREHIPCISAIRQIQSVLYLTSAVGSSPSTGSNTPSSRSKTTPKQEQSMPDCLQSQTNVPALTDTAQTPIRIFVNQRALDEEERQAAHQNCSLRSNTKSHEHSHAEEDCSV